MPPLARATTILLIQTEPPGALDSVDVGQHEVKATLEGRQATTQVVTISAEGEHATVMLVLAETPKDEPEHSAPKARAQ